MAPDYSRVKSIIESLIFVSESPLPLAKIKAVLQDLPMRDLKAILEEMRADYAQESRGICLEEVASGYQFRTKTENADWVRLLVEQKPQRLSKAALETLAIIAYNQPITKPEIENIRGVDSGSALNLLLERKLLRILGRKEVPGRPLLYGTTQEFLEIFNLMDLNALPTLKEIESLAEDDLEPFRPTGDPAPDGDRQISLLDGESPQTDTASTSKTTPVDGEATDDLDEVADDFDADEISEEPIEDESFGGDEDEDEFVEEEIDDEDDEEDAS